MSQFPQQPGYPPQQGFPPPQGYPPQGYLPPQGYPPPRAGMGCVAKLLIFLGIVFLLLVLVCCGGLFYWIKNAASDSPETVKAATEEIASIHVPAGFRPAAVMDMRLPFDGQIIVVDVGYKHQEDVKGFLTLTAWGDPFDDSSRESLQRFLDQTMAQHGILRDDRDPLQEQHTTRKPATIRGKEAVFNIIKGLDPISRRQRIHVEGTFQGKIGMVVLVFDADAAQCSAEDVEAMLNSIQ